MLVVKKYVIIPIAALILCLSFFGFKAINSHSTTQSNLLDNLRGKWEYNSTSYTMQIEFFKESNQYKAYYTISEQSGSRIDMGSREETNMELGSIDDNQLSVVLLSVYSDARYNATITKINAESIQFTLGSALDVDINLYPSKPIVLSKVL